jgi:acyl-CoA dehydrogenase
MSDSTFLRWPFFNDEHRALHWGLSHWRVPGLEDAEPVDVDAESRRLVRLLGEGGWLRYVVPAEYGGLNSHFDVRSLCLIRETLAYQSGLADFVFAMQGLGTGSITLFGSDELKRKYLPPVAQGEAIAAFAISEAEAGSDVGAMQTTARVDGNGWVIEGEKTWISNAGIADHYVVFCRIPESGEKSYGAFVIDADNPGLQVTERIEVIAPHVLGTLRFDNCRVPAAAVIGAPGAGLKIALTTLDVFRTTVAAAALGFARRALDEAVAFTRARKGFGKTIADMQMTQARIADMAVAVDAAALLIYRAAWAKDNGETRITREAAMAKLFATESAQKIIDDAVQLHGGRGVVKGETVEKLYREIRALRIYEGTSEIQKIVIAGQVYAGAPNV